jgi:hypothetical protein
MGDVTRIDGWERLLAEAVETARSTPFQWGVTDCACWAFDVRARLTGGEDVAARWRGRYTSAAGSVRIMRSLGWSNIEAMGRALLGAPLPAVLLAQRGDLVLMEKGFGVCLGAQAVGMGEAGLGWAAMPSCRMAWRV